MSCPKLLARGGRMRWRHRGAESQVEVSFPGLIRRGPYKLTVAGARRRGVREAQTPTRSCGDRCEPGARLAGSNLELTQG